VWIVVDHLSGSRRGQRQELELTATDRARLQIGRHPDCDVGFDTRRDLEASTRHAEIRTRGNDLVLFDIGSSNGTYVSGQRVHEVVLHPGDATEVQFGARGPRLRIWWDRDADPSQAPPLPAGRSRGWLLWVALAAIAAAAIVAAIALGG
jgi:hypothetical protein